MDIGNTTNNFDRGRKLDWIEYLESWVSANYL